AGWPSLLSGARCSFTGRPSLWCARRGDSAPAAPQPTDDRREIDAERQRHGSEHEHHEQQVGHVIASGVSNSLQTSASLGGSHRGNSLPRRHAITTFTMSWQMSFTISLVISLSPHAQIVRKSACPSLSRYSTSGSPSFSLAVALLALGNSSATEIGSTD